MTKVNLRKRAYGSWLRRDKAPPRQGDTLASSMAMEMEPGSREVNCEVNHITASNGGAAERANRRREKL